MHHDPVAWWTWEKFNLSWLHLTKRGNGIARERSGSTFKVQYGNPAEVRFSVILREATEESLK
jgi:hypothetical protein